MNNTFHRLDPILTLTGETLLMVGQNQKAGKVPLSQLATFLGQGGGGSGFVFADISEHIDEFSPQTTAIIGDINGVSIKAGSPVIGSVTLSSNNDIAYVGVKLAAATSYRFRLISGQVYTLYSTEKPLDPESNDGIIDLGIGTLLTITLAQTSYTANGVTTLNGTFTHNNVALPPVVFNYTQQSVDWMEVRRTGTEVIYFINDIEVLRLPQFKTNYTYYTLRSLHSYLPIPTFQYDLTGTISDHYFEVDLEGLSDLVIYQAPENLDILGMRVSKNDYFQVYENKTKILSYPQLSRLYDFDTTAPENLLADTYAVANGNPFVTLTETGSRTFDMSIVADGLASVDFNTATFTESLDNFTVQTAGTFQALTLKPDFDPDGVITQTEAKFFLDKGKFYEVLNINTGNGSNTDIYFYNGTTDTGSYIRFSIARWPTQTFKLYKKAPTDEAEVFVSNILYASSIIMNLKNDFSYRDTSSTSQSQLLVETAADYTKLFDFANNQDTQILGKLVTSMSQEAMDGNSAQYSLPLRNTALTMFQKLSYSNVGAVEATWATGQGFIELEKQKSILMMVVGASSTNDYFTGILGQSQKHITALFKLNYNPSTDEYSVDLRGVAALPNPVTFTLAPEDKLQLQIDRTEKSLSLSIGGASFSATGVVCKKMFFVSISGLFGDGIVYDAQTMHFDLSHTKTFTSVILDSIQPRDRIRIVGSDVVVAGKTAKVNDIVEFFNDRNDVLITKSVDNDNPSGVLPLSVIDYSGNPITTIRAWFNYEQKRIIISGRIYFAGNNNDGVFKIVLPLAVQKYYPLTALPIPMSGSGAIKDYAELTLKTDYVPVLGQLGYTMNVLNSNYVYGTIVIPDSTAAFA